MIIFVVYKDVPELSNFLLTRTESDLDSSVEKTLLVNPKCHVRVMLEYIRNKCKLGPNTEFDLAETSGALKGLFTLPTYTYATDLFENKGTYYLIVLLKDESKMGLQVFPQLNHDNDMYQKLEARVRRFIIYGTVGSNTTISTTRLSMKKHRKSNA